MSRFRYICGGDDGRRDVGSGGAGESLDLSEFDVLCPAALAASVSRLVFGGGAPLTTWSSLESDMAGITFAMAMGNSPAL
jgi:hypothetical protein